MIFLTYNDNFSGIYKSQVIDVCSFLKTEVKVKVRLVAFVSIRNYSQQKKLIKSNYSQSLVFPMFPKIRFWKINTFFLFFICLFSGEKKIWARGPFACNMAISLKNSGLVKKVLFDARGAYLAELTEYNVVENETILKNISAIEKKALTNSDAQLAVSTKLVNWWKEKYHFTPATCAVVPCTLSIHFTANLPTESEIQSLREKLGFSIQDVVLVYSGSSAGWQSFNLVDDYLYDLFSKNNHLKLLFLSTDIPKQSKTFLQFKNRIVTKWVKPNEVRDLLLAADYGMLIRENSITNHVASPVKFAEYLSCGLQIIISENIGDFTEFVKQHGCGFVYSSKTFLEKSSYLQKTACNTLALQHFSKGSTEIKKAYQNLLSNL